MGEGLTCSGYLSAGAAYKEDDTNTLTKMGANMSEGIMSSSQFKVIEVSDV